jgi:nucleoside 2-deoxyribosyltransferase
MSDNCLICGTTGVKEILTNGLYRQFDCDVCGQYQISFTALNVDDGIKSLSDSEKAVLCSLVFDYYSINQKPFCITSGNLSSELKAHKKTPAQILNRLIEFLYEDEYQLNTSIIYYSEFFPIAQTFDKEILMFYLKELEHRNVLAIIAARYDRGIRAELLPNGHECYPLKVALTLKGFEVYEELKKGKSKSNQVFMAVQFGSEADTFYQTYSKPAVEALHLKLQDLRQLSKAGKLTSQMEAEIRQSKLVIADVTPVQVKDKDGRDIYQHNANVYWEAGFAQGLGKPVIYMANKRSMEATKLPFDTASHLHVLYDDTSPEEVMKAMRDLQAKIYNTFPNELVLPSSRTFE